MKKQLEKIALCAGNIILSAHGSGQVYTKPGDKNFVTEYDIKVQKYIYDALRALLPEADFVGEEDTSKHTSDALRWIVDPIDGTMNFMHGLRQSCVSIALCEGSETLIGAIYQPYTKEMFYAVKDKGVTLNDEKITVSSRSPEEALITLGTSPYDRSLAPKTFSIIRDCFTFAADIRRSGTAAQDMAYIAAGRLDGFYEMMLSQWDFAAGSLIISEAGGKVCDMKGNALDMRYPSSVLCGNAATVEKMMRVIEKYA